MKNSEALINTRRRDVRMQTRPVRIVLSGVARLALWGLFLYQISKVTRSYLQYNTTTTVNYKHDRHILVPSITLSFPLYVPLKDVVKKLDPNYVLNVTTMSEKIHLYPLNLTVSEPEDIDQIQKIINEQYKNKYVKEVLQMTDMSRHFHNLSLTSCHQGSVNSSANSNSSSNSKNYFNDNRFGPFSFRSVTFDEGTFNASSCRLMHKTSQIQIHFNNGNFIPFVDSTWYGFFLHSITTIPHYLDMLLLKTGKVHLLTYHMIGIHRLLPPYRTKCLNYDEARDGSKSESDCIADCVFQTILGFKNVAENVTLSEDLENLKIDRNKYNAMFCKPIYFYDLMSSPYRLRMPVVDDRFCDKISISDYLQIQDKCGTSCLDDCVQVLYSKQVGNIPSRGPFTDAIILSHDYNNDFFIEHVPEENWFYYLGTVGGLAGMWLGLSAFSIYQNLQKAMFLISRKVSPERSIKSDNNNFRRGTKLYALERPYLQSNLGPRSKVRPVNTVCSNNSNKFQKFVFVTILILVISQTFVVSFVVNLYKNMK